PRARLAHRRGDPGQRFRHAAHHGLSRCAAVHPRADPDRPQLCPCRSARAAELGESQRAKGERVSASSNAVVLLLIAGALFLARAIAHDRFWRENAAALWRRRPIALLVVAVYLTVGLLDSVAWAPTGEGSVAGDKPRSIIDRVFRPDTFNEASYSAPL